MAHRTVLVSKTIFYIQFFFYYVNITTSEVQCWVDDLQIVLLITDYMMKIVVINVISRLLVLGNVLNHYHYH